MKVTIILGSKTDAPIAEKATKILDELGIPNQVHVASAHRTPEKLVTLIKEGADVFIACAGLSAALPGVVAAHTIKPVIGVPCSGGVSGGMDALLSVVQMPPGIPVAAVGLDRGDNAGLLAAAILALSNPELAEKLKQYRAKQREKVEQQDKEVKK